MRTLSPVSPEIHTNKYWQRYTSYAFAKADPIAPLVAEEIPRAALAMPMAFVRHQDRYILAGVLSPTPGENYFVDPNSGRWLGAYVPAHFRGYPFSLSRQEGQTKMILCVDESSGLISDTTGEPFFDKNGALSKPVQDVLDFLTKIEKNRTATDLAVAALADAGLITPWQLKLKLGGQEIEVPGLYRTDEAGLNQADDETFIKLRKTGSLPMAYAQLLSMANIRFLHKLAEMRGQAEKTPRVDLDKLLGEDDIFKF